MHDSTSQRNKALWVGSLALLTVGSVLYFTMLRKPEDSSKPAKDTKAREIVKERSAKSTQAEAKETVKDDIPQLGDVPQAKATGTFEKEVTEIIDSIAAEPTPAQQDDTDAEVVAADTTITATSTDTTKDDNTLADVENEKTTAQQDNEKEDDLEDEEEKSPLLTAAPSSSSSSDIDSSALSEQREATKPAAAPTSTDNNKNHSSSNGADLNGYWQPPATTATFQHSMGWPELFPLQQQQQQQEQETDEVKRAAVSTTLDTPAEVAPATPAVTGEKKKHTKKRMTRMEQIDQQRQNYVPTMKARCNWWPNCTNKNCKYHHPYQLCRYGDMCVYNERCMFLHPWDYEEPVRHAKQPQHTDN